MWAADAEEDIDRPWRAAAVSRRFAAASMVMASIASTYLMISRTDPLKDGTYMEWLSAGVGVVDAAVLPLRLVLLLLEIVERRLVEEGVLDDDVVDVDWGGACRMVPDASEA